MATDWKLYQDTGFEPIDAEHRQISEGLAALLEAVNGGRTREAVLGLSRLSGQFVAHFNHEEQLMAESGYPMRARHKEAHDFFLKDATRFLAELQADGLTAPFRRWITGRALEWFRFHIAANDVGLGRFLQAREAQARTAAAVEPVHP